MLAVGGIASDFWKRSLIQFASTPASVVLIGRFIGSYEVICKVIKPPNMRYRR